MPERTGEPPTAGAPPGPDPAGPRSLPVPPEPMVPPWPGAMQEVEGLPLHVRRTPENDDGSPALYVHGLGGSATNWTDLMYLLADRFNGAALDLPGFGASPPSPHGYSLDAHARAVAALLRAGDGPVHLFGNSLGGAVCTVVAARHPDLVRTLTLVSPALPVLRPSRDAVPLPLLLVPGLRTLLLRQMAAIPVEDRVRQVIDLCFADPSLVPEPRMAEAVAEARERARVPHANEALVASTRALLTRYLDPGPANLWRLAREVRAPTLLIFGTHDRLVDVRIAPVAHRRFPDNRLAVLQGVGHVAMLERPAVVARLELAWLAELDRRAG